MPILAHKLDSFQAGQIFDPLCSKLIFNGKWSVCISVDLALSWKFVLLHFVIRRTNIYSKCKWVNERFFVCYYSIIDCVEATMDEFSLSAQFNQYHKGRKSRCCCFHNGQVLVHICRSNRHKLYLFTKNSAVAIGRCTSSQRSNDVILISKIALQQQQQQQRTTTRKKSNVSFIGKKIEISEMSIRKPNWLWLLWYLFVLRLHLYKCVCIFPAKQTFALISESSQWEKTK